MVHFSIELITAYCIGLAPVKSALEGWNLRKKAESILLLWSHLPLYFIHTLLLKCVPTRSIKRHKRVWNFICSTQRDKVHIFNLLHVVRSYSIALSATEVCKQQSIRNLIFFSYRCEANHTNFLFKKIINDY